MSTPAVEEKPSQFAREGPVGNQGHVVQQGECIESIAFEHGLFWETVWNDPQNSELKRIRKNPNALLPGDKVFVREKKLKEIACAHGHRHRFKRKGVPSILCLQILDDGEPRADQPYIIEIDGKSFSGRTDAQGRLEQTVFPNANEGKLTVGEGESQTEYELLLRNLDPVDEISGAQGRLANLGYDPGPPDGRLSLKTQAALQGFQADHGLQITGRLDETTANKLAEVYETE
jgi:hypothetical protein